jgi:spermidine synthase
LPIAARSPAASSATTARFSVSDFPPLAEAAASRSPAAVHAVGSTRLGLLVFTAGAGTLATEIAASRLLAPYFGSSTIVWANIIGLILVYLALGYWLGGKVADRRPEPRLLGTIVLAAAPFIAILPFVSRPILDIAVRGLDAVSVGAVVGSFFAALALFAVPVTLLGAVSPFAIRLALDDVGEAGTVAGRLYALSTLGSILGTFLSALVLIPLIGTQRTMLGSAALLVFAAALVLGARWQLVTIAVATLLFIPPGTIKESDGLLYEAESTYQYVQVVERSDGSRALKLNEGVAVHSVWYPDSVLTGGEWDMFLLVPPLLDRPPERMLVIGNAGGTIARAYGRLYPAVEIDGVEIDPKVSEAGRRFLGLGDNPKLRVITDDGRPFLQGTSSRYDVIVVDAYRQPYIPFYLATEEFFELARERLAPGGVLALNLAAVPGDERLSEAIGSTVLAAFPQAWRWKPLRFNELVLAFDRPLAESELVRRVEGASPAVAPLVPLFREGVEPVRSEAEVLTDDRAPVEWLTDRMIIDFIAQGGELDETLLPTAP